MSRSILDYYQRIFQSQWTFVENYSIEKLVKSWIRNRKGVLIISTYRKRELKFSTEHGILAAKNSENTIRGFKVAYQQETSQKRRVGDDDAITELPKVDH